MYVIIQRYYCRNIQRHYVENILQLCCYFKATLRKKCPYSGLFWSSFFPHFPAFGLNTERYSVSLRIQSECGKMWEKCGPETRITLIRTLFMQCNTNFFFFFFIWVLLCEHRTRLHIAKKTVKRQQIAILGILSSFDFNREI